MSPFEAMEERHRDRKGHNLKVASFVRKTREPGLPPSYVVFDNGILFAVDAWLDEDHKQTDDGDQICYVVISDGEDDYIIDMADYVRENKSYANH